jgi:IS5 family transposase
MEQLEYNLLFRWFVGLSMDDAVWDATVFCKNRDRLLDGDIARKFMTCVQPPCGTAAHPDRLSRNSYHSCVSRDESCARRCARHSVLHLPMAAPHFHPWEQSSSCSPMLRSTYRRPRSVHSRAGRGLAEAKLCHMGHLLTENRNELIVEARLTEANGTAERAAALDMIDDNAKPGTVGADKGYDTSDFVAGCRERGCTPHVAQNDTNRRSAIDARTTRHPGYRISMIKRKQIEEPFGWFKTVGGFRKTRHCGRPLVEWFFVLTATAYNLIRIPTILAAAG